jgi:hypothetical protein
VGRAVAASGAGSGGGARWQQSGAARGVGRAEEAAPHFLSYLGAEIRGAELGAVICGADLFFWPLPRQKVRWLRPGPRRRDP